MNEMILLLKDQIITSFSNNFNKNVDYYNKNLSLKTKLEELTFRYKNVPQLIPDFFTGLLFRNLLVKYNDYIQSKSLAKIMDIFDEEIDIILTQVININNNPFLLYFYF